MAEKGRWTKDPGDHGDDPAELDAEHHDPDRVEHLADNRPITHDQPRTGQQGISSDRPGVDPGGYPKESTLVEKDELDGES